MNPILRTALLVLLLAGCARATAEGGGGAARGASPRPDPALQRIVEALAAGFGGDVGIYVRHLPSGATAAIRPDELFPTASMIKVPLMAALFDRVERGALRLDTLLVFRDSLRYTDEDVLGEFRDGATIPLSQVLFLAESVSDNTAALWVQALVGGGQAANQWLAAHGFDSTRVNSRTPGRRPDWEVYGWGQTTPREIAELLIRIREGRAVSPTASEAMYRLLTSNHSGPEALAGIPPTVQVATKEGAVDRSRSQVLLVNAPAGDYVLAVITKNQRDESWRPDNEGWQLIRDVSRAVYRYFNPAGPWRPAGSPSP